ncbi:hypothetical protein [Ciceribacter ferrooxidans]|uniref:Uncharacterized protein n=1 Tax=Ciceribacter ferrooxidans TaxID=2509717 RepID=A0A4Q2SZL4_9HYPH|nr:hypothetical protein [Ciceribacter ferrooxidans]RYC10074.1 hypothetical protein EUU22_18545 [Ciceribacter ferrooxidans]
MTNEIRGIVSKDILGERLDLKLAANEWCELEDEHGKSTDEILTDFFGMVESGKLRIKMLRSLFRASLSSAKPGLTLQGAGDIMAKMDLVEVGRIVGEVIVASLPQQNQEENAAPGKPKPPAKRNR